MGNEANLLLAPVHACMQGHCVVKPGKRVKESGTVQDVDEPEARAAFIWILGEHGQRIQVHARPGS